MAQNNEFKAVEVEKKKNNKKVLSFFLIMLPSLILAGDYGLSFFPNLALKGLILLLQYIVVKNLLEDYYSYVD